MRVSLLLFAANGTNYGEWWAGWVSSPLFPKESDLQSDAFADSLPTHKNGNEKYVLAVRGYYSVQYF